MVEDRVTDGRRIAQLLASEVTGREDGPLASMAVVEADREIEPSTEGSFAYGVDHDGERLAEVYVHPERARVELLAGVERGASAAADTRLRARPVASDPPRTLVFVESGAAVKGAVDVLVAAAEGA
ncbi:MAG: hypothetical protein ABEJ30_08270 [Halorientalis sp.]